jgi:ribonuclease HI
MAEYSNNRYFSALDVPEGDDLHVYVDGSFDTEAVSFYRRHYMGAGWAVVNPAGHLVGYGVSSFKTRSSNSSEWMELKAMLEFLDAMYADFPELINKDRTITIFGDNQYLLRGLHKAKTDRQMSRRLFNRLGYDYLRLVYYMTAMKLEFKWVKGHASNKFNRLADNMARFAYREQLRNGKFHLNSRQSYLDQTLSTFKNMNSQLLTVGAVQSLVKQRKTHILSQLASMKVDFTTTQDKGRTIARFSYTGTHGKGSRHAVFLKSYKPLYFALRACRYALSENMEGIDPNRAFLLHVYEAEAASIINSLVRGKELRAHGNNPAMQHEINLLRKMVDGKTLVAISKQSMEESLKQKKLAKAA